MTHDDERVGALLRRASDHVSAPASLASAVRRGARRRIVRRRAALAGTACLGVVLSIGGGYAVAGSHRDDVPVGPGTTSSPTTSPTPSPTLPAFPGRCTVERLAVPAGIPRSLVTGGDRAGRYMLGRAYPGNGRSSVVVWDHGRPTMVDMPGQDARLNDVNNAGIAVGDSFTADDVQTPWLYRAGSLSPLPATGSASARAIGEDGTIAGFRSDAAPGGQRPVAWYDPEHPAVDLPLPPGYSDGEAVDVDSDGTVVGVVSGPGKRDRGYLWRRDGTHRMLPLPTVDGGAANAFDPELIAGGVVLGVADLPHGQGLLPLAAFDLATAEFTIFDGGVAFGSANALGWVAGSARGGLWLAGPGGRTALPLLAPVRRDKLVMTEALVVTMSEDGRTIGGQSDDPKGDFKAVVWHCS
jgi:hypothetical protein